MYSNLLSQVEPEFSLHIIVTMLGPQHLLLHGKEDK